MRHARERAKLTSAIGILTMLFGALLVLAPGAGAADPAGGFRGECRTILGVSADTPVYGAKWQWSGEESALTGPTETLNGFTAQLGWEPIADGGDDGTSPDGTHFFFEDANKLVYGAGVKQANEDIEKFAFDPPADNGEFDFTNEKGNNVFSHVTLCGYTPAEDEYDLTVTKQITDQNRLDDEFEVDIDGTNGTSGSLTDDEPLTVFDASGNYTVTETVPAGWQAPTLNCGSGNVTPTSTGVWSVAVSDADVSCTLTNTPSTSSGDPDPDPVPSPEPTPEPEPGTLTVVKAVDGDDAPEDWSFPFEVTDLGSVELTDEDPEFSQDDLAAGNYTITETDAGDADLTDITCSEGADVVETAIADDGKSGSVTVALDETDAVTCTFTNTYPEVLPDQVVREPESTPAEPAALQVQGEQVARLPATGNSNSRLALIGLSMLTLGATLVRGGRRRLELLG